MNLNYFPIQILLFVMLLWPISRVWFRFRDGVIKLSGFLFWLLVWLTGVLAIFYPDFLSYLANIFHIGRGSDLAIYGALVLVFYLVFRISVIMENMHNEITKLTREIALLKEKLKLNK